MDSPGAVRRQTDSAFLTALTYALAYLPPIADGPLLPALADCIGDRGISYQASQIVGFVTGVAVVATVGSNRTLGIGLPFVRNIRFDPYDRSQGAASSTADQGETADYVVGLGGWRSHRVRGSDAGDPVAVRLAGRVYILPGGLAAPHAHSLGGTEVTVGLP